MLDTDPAAHEAVLHAEVLHAVGIHSRLAVDCSLAVLRIHLHAAVHTADEEEVMRTVGAVADHIEGCMKLRVGCAAVVVRSAKAAAVHSLAGLEGCRRR